MVFCAQLQCICIQISPSAATTTRVKATVYDGTITATATTATTATTAIVRKPLDSRAQPVATEHAVPSSTQFSTVSFVIGMCKLRLPSLHVPYTVTKRATNHGESLDFEMGGGEY